VGTCSGGDGVHGESRGNGVLGESIAFGGIGVRGTSSDGIGGSFSGGPNGVPLRLEPSSQQGPPTTGNHSMGELFVDTQGVLYFCKQSGPPGVAVWKTVTLT